MNYMFESGFLGTKAPLFMDMVTLIVAILPILVYGAILLAKSKKYLLHTIAQNIIFVVSVSVVSYFEYGVRVGGGFNSFMDDSEVSYSYALIVLITHIIIATLTLLFWAKVMIVGNYKYKKNLLPGKYSKEHKMLAKRTFVGIVLTSFSGIWVYMLLFVY